MPEGHTLHRIARDHKRLFLNQRLQVRSPQGRFEKQAESLNKKTLRNVEAYGKHLVYEFSTNQLLHVHLGLYGKFRTFRMPAPEPRGAVRVRMLGTERGFDLNGPNTCELLTHEGLNRLVGRIGPDPLREDADPEAVWNRIHKSRAAIGSLLLDQSVIAGLGNIFRAEILFIHCIHPDRPGNLITQAEFEMLWDTSVRLLKLGVRYNKIITVERPQCGKPLSKLNSLERVQIYKRPNCPRCGADVVCWELSNRTIYACEHCQV